MRNQLTHPLTHPLSHQLPHPLLIFRTYSFKNLIYVFDFICACGSESSGNNVEKVFDGGGVVVREKQGGRVIAGIREEGERFGVNTD